MTKESSQSVFHACLFMLSRDELSCIIEVSCLEYRSDNGWQEVQKRLRQVLYEFTWGVYNCDVNNLDYGISSYQYDYVCSTGNNPGESLYGYDAGQVVGLISTFLLAAFARMLCPAAVQRLTFCYKDMELMCYHCWQHWAMFVSYNMRCEFDVDISEYSSCKQLTSANYVLLSFSTR